MKGIGGGVDGALCLCLLSKLNQLLRKNKINAKHEYRRDLIKWVETNTKFKIKIFQPFRFGYLNFGNSKLFRISCFEFRI